MTANTAPKPKSGKPRKDKAAQIKHSGEAVVLKPKPDGYVFGRPTTYRPEYCEQVVEWGNLGKSRVWIACELGVHVDSLHEWSRKHPDFSAALSRAKLAEQRWWEDEGQSGLRADKFQAGAWAKNMACRFRNDWTDTSRQELTGKDGGAIQIEETTDPLERARRLAFLLASGQEKLAENG